jgi:hypothetical protein
MDTFLRLRDEHLLTIAGGLLFLFTFLTIVGAVALVQWRKARQHALEVRFKQELVSDGWTVDDIERLLGAREAAADPLEPPSDPNRSRAFSAPSRRTAGAWA